MTQKEKNLSNDEAKPIVSDSSDRWYVNTYSDNYNSVKEIDNIHELFTQSSNSTGVAFNTISILILVTNDESVTATKYITRELPKFDYGSRKKADSANRLIYIIDNNGLAKSEVARRDLVRNITKEFEVRGDTLTIVFINQEVGIAIRQILSYVTLMYNSYAKLTQLYELEAEIRTLIDNT